MKDLRDLKPANESLTGPVLRRGISDVPQLSPDSQGAVGRSDKSVAVKDKSVADKISPSQGLYYDAASAMYLDSPESLADIAALRTPTCLVCVPPVTFADMLQVNPPS